MIARLKGLLIDIHTDHVVIDINGVGYEVYASSNMVADLSEFMHKVVSVHIHTHVREDVIQLFGFLEKEEKEFFLALLKVNGIGPKSALSVLSGARLNQIIEMIEGEDVKALSKLPKVGKKTAEQMILTLKGKLVISVKEMKSVVSPLSVQQKQISSALVNLGFKIQDVSMFMDELDPKISLEEGIRLGLSALSQIDRG